jgi:hypothetical protein
MYTAISAVCYFWPDESTGVEFVPLSTFTEEGISRVMEIACDKLLEQRVEAKLAQQVRFDSCQFPSHCTSPSVVSVSICASDTISRPLHARIAFFFFFFIICSVSVLSTVRS